ncbi:MAG: type III secretion system chaperone [Chlamydiales bacterium]|nr:type III secretion system chaperone [Chlamydiales bacterium]
MKLSQLMDLYRKEIGLDKAIPTNDAGQYVIYMDKDVSFTVSDLNPGLGMLCEVAPMPKDSQEQFYTQMMLANLFGQGTEGAVLGLSDDGNTLTLSKDMEYNLEYEMFKEALEDFMNAIDFWRDEATNFKAA